MPAELTADKVNNLSESSSMFDQGRLKLQLNKFSEAETLLKNAFHQRELALGKDDQGLAQIIDELGICYLQSGRYEEAESQFRSSLAILEKNFYAGHARLYPVLDHLGDCLMRKGQYSDAEPILKRALEISEKTVSGEHRAIFELIWKLTQTYLKLEKFNEAETVLAKALKQLDTPLGPIDEFRFQLAVTLAALGKDKEAETSYRQAIFGLQQRKDYPRLAECLDSFAAFLKKTGQNAQVEELTERARLFRDASGQRHDICPATLLRA